MNSCNTKSELVAHLLSLSAAKRAELIQVIQDALAEVQPGAIRNGQNAAVPKIPKGFVLINLSESEKRELQKLVRESGMELRGALRNALFYLRERAKNAARIKRLTGMNYQQQWDFFGCFHSQN